MKFKPGDKKPINSGRKKGKLNAKTEHFFEICEKMNHDPVTFNVMLAQNDWQSLGYPNRTFTSFTKSGETFETDYISVNDRVSANNKLLEFMYPKRKAIEVTSGEKDNTAIILAYNPKELKPSVKK